MSKKKKTTGRRAGESWSPFSRKPRSEETTTDVPSPPAPPARVEEEAPRAPLPPPPPAPKAKPAVPRADRYVDQEKCWLAIDTVGGVKAAWAVVANPTTPEVYVAPLGVVNKWKQRIQARAAELGIQVGEKGRKRRGIT